MKIPFKEALDNAGGCSIPLTLIVLAEWHCDGETNLKVEGRYISEVEVKGGSDGQVKTILNCRIPDILINRNGQQGGELAQYLG